MADGSRVLDLAPQPAFAAPMPIAGEIDIQISTARAYPRSIEGFRKQIMALATLTPEIAQSCLYALPRGGKIIQGPSIRFAEMAIPTWGNCRVGGRVVRVEQEFVIAQGVYHDLESNTAITMESQRRIIDSKGERFNVDMIGTTGNAARSIAIRNAVTQGVPRALWQDAYLAARKAAVGDIKTMAQRRQTAMEAFAPFGVVPAQIFAALGVVGMHDIGPDQLSILFGWLTAIKDESQDPEQIFAPIKARAPAGPPKAPEAPKDQGPPPPAPPAKQPAQAEQNAGAGVNAPTASEAGGEGRHPEPPAEGPEKRVPPEAARDPEDPLEAEVRNELADCKTLGDIGIAMSFLNIGIEKLQSSNPPAHARIVQMIDEAKARFETEAAQ